jgi:hypothetical protein
VTLNETFSLSRTQRGCHLNQELVHSGLCTARKPSKLGQSLPQSFGVEGFAEQLLADVFTRFDQFSAERSEPLVLGLKALLEFGMTFERIPQMKWPHSKRTPGQHRIFTARRTRPALPPH